MKRHCRWLLVCLALLALNASALGARQGEAPEAKPFGPQAVWTLPIKALTACQKKTPTSADCLTKVMKQTGASQQALSINRLLQGDGYMSAFRPMGRVNLATVEFPMRANTNQAAVLVGGVPPLVSSELPGADINISTAPAYPALKRLFPNIEFWPTSADFRDIKRLSNGGQSFEFAYPLLNGCHACDLAGYALVSLDFGPDGVYHGPRLIRLEPAK